MTNPTRKDLIDVQLARQWAERNKTCEVSSPEIQAAANFILANTPAPTMAEVKWDDDKHFLAEANHPTWGRSAMLGLDKDGWIEVISWDEDGPAIHSAIPYYLVPTGKRYALTEVQE